MLDANQRDMDDEIVVGALGRGCCNDTLNRAAAGA
jgi:hypothetical protein